MIGDVSVRAPGLTTRSVRASGRPTAAWRRRAIEGVVAVLAFAVWGKLAYVGCLRLLARVEGLPVKGSIIIDVLSLGIGVAGGLAGMAALWALVMRAIGRTPASLVGAPDDDDFDTRYRTARSDPRDPPIPDDRPR